MSRFSPYKSQNSHRSSLYSNLLTQWKITNPSTPFSTYVQHLDLNEQLSLEEILEIEKCLLKTCVLCKNGILTTNGSQISCDSCHIAFILNVIFTFFIIDSSRGVD